MLRVGCYVVLVLSLAVPASLSAQTSADSGTFVVRHAGDTVATERFSRTPTHLEGTLAIHNSKGTSERWSAVVAPDATLPLIEVTVREGAGSEAGKAKVRQRARVMFKDDSAAVDEVGDAGIMTRIFGTERGAIPYLNLSFALLEQGIRRARATPGTDQVAFFNLAGGQTKSAKVSPLGTDSVNLDLGDVEFHLRVDAAGQVLGGRIPKQDVVVERR